MPYLRVFDGAALRIFKNTFNTMKVFYKKGSKVFDTFYRPQYEATHSGKLFFFWPLQLASNSQLKLYFLIGHCDISI